MLTVNDHRRDSAGMRYVYPVVSRRAGGVSVGINLNVNNACNWACIYCQVPGLKRGSPPPVDLDRLEAELRGFLHKDVLADYLQKNVPAGSRRLMDVAFSGNGEPTSAPEFAEVVGRLIAVLREMDLLNALKIRLITNGSFMHRETVRAGIAAIGAVQGEVWFKLDCATESGMQRINGVRIAPERVRASLMQCCALAPTWVQTCCFALDGEAASGEAQQRYLELIGSFKEHLQGVHLYGLARPSLQPEAHRLGPLGAAEFTAFSRKIAALGLRVVENP